MDREYDPIHMGPKNLSLTKGTVYFHLPLFQIQRRMDIRIQRNAGIGMSQNFTQCLNVHPALHTPRRKRMSQSMEIDAGYVARTDFFVVTVFKRPWVRKIFIS